MSEIPWAEQQAVAEREYRLDVIRDMMARWRYLDAYEEATHERPPSLKGATP